MGNLTIFPHLLCHTTAPALLHILRSDLIGDLLVAEVILHAHCDAHLVAHRDVTKLVGEVVAAVYAHHLFAFKGAVGFYFLETRNGYIRYASSQKRIPFITL